MNAIRFAHQFFHFNQPQWDAYWRGGTPHLSDLSILFEAEIFSRRSLKSGGIHSLQAGLAEFEKILFREEKAGIRSIHVKDPEFPQALFTYLPPERHPVFLHFRGAPLPEEKQIIAVVGTRYPSPNGADSAASFSAYYTTLGIHVISGLAKGIDTIAHEENKRIGTIAVLGSGVQDIYPRENEKLGENILSRGGTLLSPFPLGQVPLPCNFPIRNELIGALSIGTLVVEGAETSGASVTGKQALAMGKTVIALTQDFRTGFGRGAIRLQQAGAVFVTTEEESLHALYARVGGYDGKHIPNGCRGRKKEFSLKDFLVVTGKDIGPALVLLEEGLSTGKIEKTGPDLYRLKSGGNQP